MRDAIGIRPRHSFDTGKLKCPDTWSALLFQVDGKRFEAGAVAFQKSSLARPDASLQSIVVMLQILNPIPLAQASNFFFSRQQLWKIRVRSPSRFETVTIFIFASGVANHRVRPGQSKLGLWVVLATAALGNSDPINQAVGRITFGKPLKQGKSDFAWL